LRLFLLAALILTLPASALAAPFEGTVEYTYKYAGEGADQFEAFAPTGTTHEFAGGAARVTLEGGAAAAMMGSILASADGKIAMLKDDEKTVYRMASDAPGDVKRTVTAEEERITILDHRCRKYRVVTDDTEMFVWAAEDIDAPIEAAADRKLAMKGISGLVLKRMTTLTFGDMSVTSIETATKLTVGAPDAARFKVPSDYEVKDFEMP
jgi:hypothetical protein